MKPIAEKNEGPAEANPLLLISTIGGFGGVERFLCNLAVTLKENGWRPILLFPESEHSPLLAEWCAKGGVEVTFGSPELDTNVTRSFRRQMTEIAAFVRRYAPCVVHINYPSSYLSLKDCAAIRWAGGTLITSLHGIAAPQPRYEVWKKRSITRLASLLSCTVTVNSRATHIAARRAGIAEKSLSIVPCGVPDPVAVPRDDARRQFGLKPEQFVVVSAGRLVPQKRMNEVVQAVSAVSRRGVPATLLIAGDGPERSSLETLAAELRAPARLLGRLSDLSSLYAAADVFALPSEEESFGLVYLEAALHGVPSVAVNQGGVPDVIEDRETGILIDVEDTLALADALYYLYQNPEARRQMGQSARERTRKHYGAEQMGANFGRLYRQYAPVRRVISAALILAGFGTLLNLQ